MASALWPSFNAMLGKIPAAGRGFKGIVSYLLRGQAGKEKHRGAAAERRDATARSVGNRVLFVSTENLLTNDAEKAARVMRATANRSTRCKAPVYHFVISWRPQDRPDFATMRSIVDGACADMGLDGLQRIVIGHDDTRHRHVHVVVNRIHPETGKAWNRRQDWVRLEVSLARLAVKHGYERVPGRHNAPTRFADAPKKAPDREYQLARRKGAPTPRTKWNQARIVSERHCLIAVFERSRSWQQLHQELSRLGYRLDAKGAGLVVRDATSEVKLSLLSKAFRITTLEQRFGTAFQPALQLPERAPCRAPERGNADTQAALPQDKATPVLAEALPQVDSSEDARKHSDIEPAAPAANAYDEDDDEDDSPRRHRGRSR